MTNTWPAYLASPGINWSTLSEMRKSPLHYLHRLRNPMTDTKSTVKGRACHAALFEPLRFQTEFAIWTEKVRNGKAWDAFEAENEAAGKSILLPGEYDEACYMAEAVQAHSLARELITGGVSEQSIYWTDPVTGLRCKARIDYLRPDRIIDLKSTRDGSSYGFTRNAYRYGYECQGAHYREGCNHNGAGMLPVTLVVVENTAPYDVAVYHYDDDALYAGAEEVSDLLQKVKACQDADHWPGRYSEAQTLRLPTWVYGESDDDVGDDLIVGGNCDE